MKLLLSTLALIAAPLPTALAQTDPFVLFDHRGGRLPGWGHTLVDAGDLTGDGAHDLVVGTFRHGGGGEIATVHTGAFGALLFRLEAPFVPLFFGDAFVPVADETGDGRPELVALGSHSNDPNSPDGMILVYSGADGAVLRQLAPPPGVVLIGHGQRALRTPGDVDLDGADDLVVRAVQPGGTQLELTLLSGATGQVLWSVAPAAPAGFVWNMVALVSDMDGDGLPDLAVPAREGPTVRVELRSSGSGALLSQFTHPDLGVLTGNGEPFLSVADVDGDGWRDLASGDVFTGSAALYSTATGAQLHRAGCDTNPLPCFGSRLIEVGDMNGDDRPDLLALESNVFGTDGVRLFGLDLTRKAPILFEELMSNLAGGYSDLTRIAPLPGVDRSGFPTFAMFEELTGLVSIRRFRPVFLGAR